MQKYLTTAIICLIIFFSNVDGAAQPLKRSCADFSAKGTPVVRRVIYDGNDQPYNVLCVYQGVDVYTMIESFNKTNSLDANIAASFSVDNPVNQDVADNKAFPIDLYRLSKDRMKYLADRSTFIWSSCDVITNPNNTFNPLSVGTDYIISSLNADSRKLLFDTAFVHNGINNCMTVRGMLFGEYFDDKSIPFYSKSNVHFHSSIDESTDLCGKHNFNFITNPVDSAQCGVRDYPPNAPASVNVFGSYNKCTSQFACAKNDNSITTWWLGAPMPGTS
ncbi:uncharacterized protein TRIADDRAFT_63702 [Trichoplax adhaerens]|uniref:Uncharacterized protein n=1 Tax=Trichoplax adhaerens TaxID=10228 RepID=B3RMH3_TRIAD|nr:predicted protein [Trichoplax adhaerens]EDV28366.1 predicted protein [Trichoplax adhaerens]|eukprot:XP_002110200.1 predicted protein [Trichoplax adhaerens]